MKLNKKDFEEFENANRILSILLQMQSIDEPYSLLKKIQYPNLKCAIVVFPYLVNISMRSQDIRFVRYLAHFKLSFLSFDMNTLSDDVLQRYIYSLYLLKTTLPYHFQDDSDDKSHWDSAYKTYYMWLCILHHHNSYQSLAFHQYNTFEKAFHVECRHCHNDVHSIFIDPTADSIQPTTFELQEHEPLFFYDIMQSIMPTLTIIHEEKLSVALPYLYGTYTCSICGSKNIVIDAITEHLIHSKKIILPSDEYIQRIVSMIDTISPSSKQDVYRKWSLVLYAISLYDVRYGHNHLDRYLLALKTTQEAGYNITNTFVLLEEALSVAKLPHQPKEKVALVYRLAGSLYASSIFYVKQYPHKAIKYHHKAYVLYTELFGKDHKETCLCEQDYYYSVAQISNDHMNDLLDFIKKRESDLLFSPEELANLYEKMSRLYQKKEDFISAIFYQKKFLSFLEASKIKIEAEETEKSQKKEELEHQNKIIASTLQSLGELYQQTNDTETALSYFEKSLQLYLKNISSFPVVSHKFQPKTDAFIHDMQTISEVYLNIACLHEEKKQFHDALKYYKKSLAFWEAVTEPTFFESGSLHMKIGLVHMQLHQHKKGFQSLLKALSICNNRIQAKPPAQELMACKDSMNLLIDILSPIVETLPPLQKNKIPKELFQYLHNNK